MLTQERRARDISAAIGRISVGRSQGPAGSRRNVGDDGFEPPTFSV